MGRRRWQSTLLSATYCLLTLVASGDDINVFRLLAPIDIDPPPSDLLPPDDPNSDFSLVNDAGPLPAPTDQPDLGGLPAVVEPLAGWLAWAEPARLPVRLAEPGPAPPCLLCPPLRC